MSYRHFHAVVFDFFGTLTRAVRRGPAHADIARSLGCDPTDFVAVLDRTFLDRSTGRFGSAIETLRWVCAQLGVRPSNARLAAACEARVAALRADTGLRPDAMAALRALRLRDQRVAVVSDCGYELPAFFPELPIAPLVDVAVFSVDVGVCKPHEAIYLAACNRLGVSPFRCLYVGDGGSHELTGAHDVGMTALRLTETDLVRHLTFEADEDWTGGESPTLLKAVAYLDRLQNAASAVVSGPRLGQRFWPMGQGPR